MGSSATTGSAGITTTTKAGGMGEIKQIIYVRYVAEMTTTKSLYLLKAISQYKLVSVFIDKALNDCQD
jgi:uracil phosphoribosyltransferase